MTVQRINLNAEEIFQKQWLTYQTVRDSAQGFTLIAQDMLVCVNFTQAMRSPYNAYLRCGLQAPYGSMCGRHACCLGRSIA